MTQFNYEKADTMEKRVATLGERSVVRALLFYHGRKLVEQEECKEYRVYQMTDVEKQRTGIDIVEEWTDAAGEFHKKAHEVKTETVTVCPMGKSRQPELSRYIDDGQERRGSGNTFVELMQNRSRGDIGWYPKMKASQEAVEQEYSEGRDMWIVAYQPRPMKLKTDHYLYYEIDDDGNEVVYGSKDGKQVYALEGHNSGFLQWQIPFQNYSKIVDTYLSETGEERRRAVRETDGVIIPVGKFFSEYEYTDDGRPIYDKPNAAGCRAFLDRWVWTQEKKDADEPGSWTEEDYAPLELKASRG